MKPHDLIQNFAPYLRRIAIVDIIIFIVAGLVCWLAGWHTIQRYGFVLVLTGVGVILIGTLSLLGGYSVRESFDYQYGRSVSHMDVHERSKLDLADTFASYRFLIGATLVAILPIAIGISLQLLI